MLNVLYQAAHANDPLTGFMALASLMNPVAWWLSFLPPDPGMRVIRTGKTTVNTSASFVQAQCWEDEHNDRLLRFVAQGGDPRDFATLSAAWLHMKSTNRA